MWRCLLLSFLLLLAPSPASASWTTRYDGHFRHWGEWYFPWEDWRWFKSQGICESGLNPLARGPAGDAGIMQLIPVTARAMGVVNAFDPEDNIRGGIKLDAANWSYWSAIPNKNERRRFMQASYNAGPGNISKARALAGGASTWAAVAAKLERVTGKWAATTRKYVADIHRVYEEIAR